MRNEKTAVAAGVSKALGAPIVDCTIAQAQVLGTALAKSTSKNLADWRDALLRCPTGEVRDALRAAFVVAFVDAEKVTKKQANNRFDYIASKFAAPETSRKSAYNDRKRAKGGGRKSKDASGSEHAVDARTLAAWVSVALGRIGKAQLTVAEPSFVALLGEIAADLHGNSAEAKQAANKKSAKGDDK